MRSRSASLLSLTPWLAFERFLATIVCRAGKKFCNFRLDNELHESRLLFWQMAQLKLTGFLYWNLNAWEGHTDPANNTASYVPIDVGALTTPYIDPADWTPWQTHSNDVGDGQLTLAGTEGPIATIRLHSIRDGIEDFGYFSLLHDKKGDAAVQEAISKMSTPGDLQQHIGGSMAELREMMAQRDAVAAMITKSSPQ